MLKTILFLIICMISSGFLFCQSTIGISEELNKELQMKDSLLFNIGYNQCDTAQLRLLISDDFEFYHDKNGFLNSKEMLLQSIPNLCKMKYKASRELLDNSLQVYPLYAGERLYGAIQIGTHLFYGEEEGKEKYVTSTAKFTHVWMIEKDQWKLARILSFDHQIPED